MPYNSFNSNIFANAFANTACNKITEALRVEFGVSETNAAFALSGWAAEHFQNPTDIETIRNISFVVTDSEMYSFLVSSLSSLINPLTIIAFSDRLQIRLVNNVFIEIWLRTGTLATTSIFNIRLQTSATIPAFLLTFYVSGTVVGSPPVLIHDLDQIFNPGGNALYAQDWLLNPNRITLSWTQGDATPNPIDITTVIKNYETDLRFRFFSAFEVEVISNLGTGNGLVSPWFVAEINNGTTYVLDTNPLEVTTVVSFLNFALLDGGSYNTSLVYRVTGLDSRTGERGIAEERTLDITLNVDGAGTQFSNPKRLDYTLIRTEGLPATQELFVNVLGSYTISANKRFSINGEGLTDESTANFVIKRAQGPQTFTIGLTSEAANLPDGNTSNAIAVKSTGDGLLIPVGIFVAEDNTVSVVPAAFNFEATIGVSEAPVQTIQVNSPLSYTYEIPPWLTIIGDLGNSFVGTIDPADSDNFSPGVYTDEIIFTSSEGVTVVPVSYTVNANSFTALLSNKINFTRDQLFINYATKNTGTYLRALLNLKWFTFLDTENVMNYAQHFPIFNGIGQMHPGDFIHNIMDSLSDIGQFIPTDLESRVEIPFDYYTPSVLDIALEERTYADDETLATFELNNLLFIKGTKPQAFADDCGVMASEYPVRVTANSYGIINFIKRTGVHTIEVFVNGSKERDIVHDTVTDSLFGMLFSFANYVPGDLVYLKVTSEDGAVYERKFYVFPENKESYHLAWVTEHEQLEVFEFTGGFSIDTNYDRVENNVYKNLVTVTEILETNKSQPLVANTGWVLKDNHVLLDSLMRSKRVWLFLPNTDYKIAMVPQSKKLANYDTETAQYAYNVEFKINPDNDAKVYPR